MSTTISDILAKEEKPEGTDQPIPAKGISEEKQGKEKPEGIDQPLPAPAIPQIAIPQTEPKQITPKKLTQEDLDRARGGTNVFDIINMSKPEAPDERGLARNRTIGSIGDGVKLLAQMYAAGKGAHIRPDNPDKSLSAYFLNEENKIRDLYNKQLYAYKQNMLNAEIKKQYDDEARNNNYEDWLKKQTVLAGIETAKQQTKSDQTENNQTWQSGENDKKIESEKTKEYGRNTRHSQTVAETRRHHEFTENNPGNNPGKVDNTKLAGQALNDPGFIKFMEDKPELFYRINKDKQTGNVISKTLIQNPLFLGSTYSEYLKSKNVQQPPKDGSNGTSTEKKIGW